MPLSDFLTSLTTDGRPRVCRSLVIPGPWLRDLPDTLRRVDQQARRRAPGDPPELDLLAATWATVLMYRACQFVAHRDMPAELLVDWLESDCPMSASPESVWSVDLVLMQLPALAKLTRAIAPEDPLLAHLDRIGGQWPLSSVGQPGVQARSVALEMAHPSLAAIYVDRVIERHAIDRLDDPVTREAVACALGDHPGLSPRTAQGLAQAARTAVTPQEERSP